MILRTAVCAGEQIFPCLTWLQGRGEILAEGKGVQVEC